MGHKKLAAAAVGFCLAFLTCRAESVEEAKRGALQAAESWLALLDSASYAETWENSANLMKEAMTEEAWSRTVHSVRSALGKPISRVLKSSRYATSLPGAPDGRYVVIQFETTFERKKSSIETVTPLLEADGRWRVSGYYIR